MTGRAGEKYDVETTLLVTSTESANPHFEIIGTQVVAARPLRTSVLSAHER